MFRLENIQYLYAFALIPLMALVYIFAWRRRNNALKKMGDQAIVKLLLPDVSRAKPIFKFVLLMLGMIALISGILNPQIGTKLTDVKREGADIMIALDVSNSMKAEDFSPNRLERAKQSISKFIDKLEGDRIGLIVFAGEAYVQLPITTDYGAAKLFMETIDSDVVPTQGTAIAPAIDLAMESFGKDEGKNKAIIIISDGENHQDEAIGSAEKAAAKGIVIHTIGMGSPAGAPIPVYKNKVQVGFKKDNQGGTVITKLNEQLLQSIAGTANGVYIRASGAETGLNPLLAEIQKLDKKQFESKIYSDYDDKFHYFIAAALILLVLEMLFSERKSKLFERLNLFGQNKQ